MNLRYKTHRIVNGKLRWVVVDNYGDIISMNPAIEELKCLEIEPRKLYDTLRKYTDKELLNFLTDFEKENKRIPSSKDFYKNPRYPSFPVYQRRFGSWQNALKLVGLDIESMAKKRILENNDQKSRFAEMIIKDHFEKNTIDLSGKNKLSHCDGICPNGMTYDVKSSKLYVGGYWTFRVVNKYKEKIEIYYLLAFNSDYMKLIHVWRIPGKIIEGENIYVGLFGRKFNVENMKEYDITDKINKIDICV